MEAPLIDESEELKKHLHECAWRVTQWDDGSGRMGAVTLGTATAWGSAGGGGAKGYHHNLYNCITSIKDGEINSLQNSLMEAR